MHRAYCFGPPFQGRPDYFYLRVLSRCFFWSLRCVDGYISLGCFQLPSFTVVVMFFFMAHPHELERWRNSTRKFRIICVVVA